jgi:hypothetical protein
MSALALRRKLQAQPNRSRIGIVRHIWPAVMPNYVDDNKRMNQHAYSASMNSKPIYDEYDPWATFEPSPLVRRNPKRVRNRKPTLASVAKQAAKAGIHVARYEVDTHGKIIVITGTSVASVMTNSTGTDINADEWK